MARIWGNLHSRTYCHGNCFEKMRITPQQYFEEPQPPNSNVNYYPVLLAVLVGGLIAITIVAIMKK